MRHWIASVFMVVILQSTHSLTSCAITQSILCHLGSSATFLIPYQMTLLHINALVFDLQVISRPAQRDISPLLTATSYFIDLGQKPTLKSVNVSGKYSTFQLPFLAQREELIIPLAPKQSVWNFHKVTLPLQKTTPQHVPSDSSLASLRIFHLINMSKMTRHQLKSHTGRLSWPWWKKAPSSGEYIQPNVTN